MAMAGLDKLHNLGYGLTRGHRIFDVQTDGPYVYDKDKYEELAAAVAQTIQEMMQNDFGMKKVHLPYAELSQNQQPKVQIPVYLSPNADTTDTLLILLCGTGLVSAGQWARSLCVNEGFETGSVLPFLVWTTLDTNMAVLVLNPNYRTVANAYKLPDAQAEMDPTNHVNDAWDFIKSKLPNIRKIVMVSHSYGGVQTLRLLQYGGEELLQRLKGVAFTDAVLPQDRIKELPDPARDFFVHKCVNFVTSNLPRGTILSPPNPPRANSDTATASGNAATTVAKAKVSKKRKFFTGCGGCVGGGQQVEETAGSTQPTASGTQPAASGTQPVLYRCLEQSAGTLKHESTTMAAFVGIRYFIQDVTAQPALQSQSDPGTNQILSSDQKW